MQILNSFITGFCVSCVLLGVLYMLCPSGSMANSVKYVFCLCFVCCIVTAVSRLPKPDFSFFQKSQQSEIVSQQNAEVSARAVFAEALRQQNINFKKINVYTNKLSDGSIVINRVEVYSTEEAGKITQAIDSDYYEVVVINE